MSHTVKRKTTVKNLTALKRALSKIAGAKLLGNDRYQFYSGSATGIGISLPNWRYPIVVDTQTGEVAFDNYEGRWGDQHDLDNMLQKYAVEAATMQAEALGANYEVATLDNGDIKITVNVGGYGVDGGDEQAGEGGYAVG